MKPLRNLAFVINSSKPGADDLAGELMAIARAAGVRFKRTGRFPLPKGYLGGCDACCVIGGDGTLLGVINEAARQQVPVIGINRGSLGFLTTLSSEEARLSFLGILQGDFRKEHRAMLACSRQKGRVELALNDVVIKDEVNSRLMHLEVFADGELVTDYLCDGLIFSTATGSTAYNLSAGGPIIHPSADVIAMTPICPHTLTNRSLIFRDTVKLKVLNHNKEARLLVGMDGHSSVRVAQDQPLEIAISKIRLPLVQQTHHSYFSVVRTKLKWSGGAAGRK